MKSLQVKDWMASDVITAHPNMGMLKAHKMMREKGIRRLPVVDRWGKLVGLVTRSDVREAQPSDATTLNVWEINYLLSELQLKDIMTTDVVTIHADDTIKTAASLMNDRKIGALPVVDGHNKVVGIITESDVFRILIAWFNEEIGTDA
jgi:acetoin utilization protein AcuB